MNPAARPSTAPAKSGASIPSHMTDATPARTTALPTRATTTNAATQKTKTALIAAFSTSAELTVGA